MIACCAFGSVMTEVLGISSRIFPSLAAVSCEGVCVAAVAPCIWVVVVQPEQDGNCGGAGGLGVTGKGYQSRPAAANGRTQSSTRIDHCVVTAATYYQ